MLVLGRNVRRLACRLIGSPPHLIIIYDGEFTHSAIHMRVPASALKEHGQLPLKPKYIQLTVAVNRGNYPEIIQRF